MKKKEESAIMLHKRDKWEVVTVSLKQREIALLNELNNYEGYVTLESLAKVFNVSTRTLKRDVQVLKDEGYEILTKTGSGIKLAKPTYIIFSSPKAPSWEKKSRIHFIVQQLLENNGSYLTYEKLGEDLYVSKSTIAKDMAAVTKYLSELKTPLETKRKYGIKVELMPSKWCQVYTKHLKNVMEENQISLRELLSDIIELEELLVFEQMLRDVLKYEVSDYDIDELLLGMSVLIYKLKHSNASIEAAFTYQSVDKRIDKFATTFVEVLFAKKKAHLSTADANYVKMLVASCQIVIPENSAIEKLDNILRKFFKEEGLDISKFGQEFKSLSRHISERSKNLSECTIQENPIAEHIEEKYPEAYALSTKLAQRLENSWRYTASVHEISYICAHLTVILKKSKRKNVIIVCETGGGMCHLLAEQVKLKIPDVHVIDVVPKEELTTALSINLEVHLVLGTFEVDVNKLKIPFLRVSPLLSQREVKAIDYY